MRAVLSDLEITIEQKNAAVEVGELPHHPGRSRADAAAFSKSDQQRAEISASPATSREVVVEGRIYQMKERNIAGAAPGQQICKIVVRDNGIGFDPKFAEQIFVVFQRLHSRSEYEGTGIGLAVCRKITDRHGGTIVAKSAEGQGAAFIVTLPVTQTSPQAHE